MSEDLQRARRVPQKIDRLPPSSVEAEQAVLGCCLLSPVSCLDECEQKLRMGADVFYDLRHQELYRQLRAMHQEQRGGIDTITLHNWLRDKGALEKVGGVAYFSGLSDGVHSAAALPYYIEIVLEKYLVRKVIQSCVSLTGQAFEHDGDVTEIIGEFEGVARRMREDAEAARNGTAKPLTETAQAAIADWEWANEHRGELTGIPSGLVDLDKLLWGWQKEDLIVVGARPSVGKSSLVFGFADVAAVDKRIPTLVVSLETSAKGFFKRVACRRARVSQTVLRRGEATEGDFSRLTVEVARITGSPLHVIDKPGLNITQVAAAVRQHVQQHSVQLVIVDYLQKIKATYRHEKRTYEVSQVSEGLKAIAEEHNVPVIAAAQLNREPDKSGKGQNPRPPRLSDLADSGQIERDADVTILIHHDGEESFLNVAKGRDVPTGVVPVMFHREWTRFDSAARVSQDDKPNYDHDRD